MTVNSIFTKKKRTLLITILLSFSGFYLSQASADSTISRVYQEEMYPIPSCINGASHDYCDTVQRENFLMSLELVIKNNERNIPLSEWHKTFASPYLLSLGFRADDTYGNGLLWLTKDPEVTDILLRNGMAEPDFNLIPHYHYTLGPKPSNVTPLIIAIEDGSLERVNSLLKYGANPRQPSALAAAIKSRVPEITIRLLDQGATYTLPARNCGSGVAEILCTFVDQLLNQDQLSEDAETILLLYGSPHKRVYSWKNQGEAEQKKLDHLLGKAILNRDANSVEQHLSMGANPNGFIHCDTETEAQILGLSELENCSAGFLSDALYIEKNELKDSISRLLITYGASIRPISPSCPFGFQVQPPDVTCGVPATYTNLIQDKDLADVISSFDPIPQEERNAKPVTADANEAGFWPNLTELAKVVLQMDRQYSKQKVFNHIAEEYLLEFTDTSSPVCTCLGIKPSSMKSSFKPFCQTAFQNLTPEAQKPLCKTEY